VRQRSLWVRYFDAKYYLLQRHAERRVLQEGYYGGDRGLPHVALEAELLKAQEGRLAKSRQNLREKLVGVCFAEAPMPNDSRVSGSAATTSRSSFAGTGSIASSMISGGLCGSGAALASK
jgi:hypothetical protein